jgi:hypothetical protein
MEPSSKICLAQEALQRDRAANTNLPSVKALAERAATVWSAQAETARAREVREVARLDRVRAVQAAQQSDQTGL